MVFKYAYVLPLIIGICFPLTFATTYAIALYREDVRPIFPFISDTGTWSPESCIFSLVLNAGALIMGTVAYIRYRQVREVLQKDEFDAKTRKVNVIAFLMGVFGAIGVSVVGNFQETSVFEVHVLGAFLAFGLGTFYQYLQTYISFKIYPAFGWKSINIARVICSIISCLSSNATFIFSTLAFVNYRGKIENITHWSVDDGGYQFLLAGAANEWVLVINTMVFFMLFTKEFKQISISEPTITIIA